MKKFAKWILFILGIVCLVILSHKYLFASFSIPSNGMANTLLEGDKILVNEAEYQLLNKVPQRNEVVVFRNPLNTKDIFINRCAGIAGQTIKLDSLFTYIPKGTNPNQRILYRYPNEKRRIVENALKKLKISTTSATEGNDTSLIINLSKYQFYLVKQQLNSPSWFRKVKPNGHKTYLLTIPKKGLTISIKPWNMNLLGNTILLHEGKNAKVIGNSLYINKRKVESYTFTQNYYWMASDNSINTNDSRRFGFVPEENLIGKAEYVWFSKKPKTGILEGVRKDRILKKIH